MSRVKWIEHKGKKIQYIDYSGLKSSEELLQVLDEAVKEEIASPTKMLVLANFEGVSAGTDFMERIKKTGKEVGSQKILKTAAIGIGGVKNVLFETYLRFTGDKNTRSFDNEAKALDWLVE
jgi:hypothetical protein